MFARYQPRPIKWLGTESVGHQLKTYSICHPDLEFDRKRFDGGWKLAMDALPHPSVTAVRPGVGFVVLHQASSSDYLILGWWDRENELPTRVFVNSGDGWRSAGPSESFCVWDLQVVCWERDAYVATVLAGRDDGIEAYLAAVMK